MDTGTYTWIIDQQTLQQMKTAKLKDEFASDIFKIAELNWQLEVYPNGHRDDTEGSFLVMLKLTSIPHGWHHLVANRRIECIETATSQVCHVKKYERGKYNGWGRNIMKFEEISNLNQLSFSVHVTVLRIILTDDQKIFYDKIKSCPMKSKMDWKMDKNVFDLVKKAHTGKIFTSATIGDIWCLEIFPNGSELKREGWCNVRFRNIGLPQDVLIVDANWKINFVLKGETEKIIRVNQTFPFSEEDIYGWGQERLSFQELQNYESLEITIEIDIINQYDGDGKDTTSTKWGNFVANTPQDIKEEKQAEEKDEKKDEKPGAPEIAVNDGYEERFNSIEAQLQSISTQLQQLTEKQREQDEMNQKISGNQEEIIQMKEELQNISRSQQQNTDKIKQQNIAHNHQRQKSTNDIMSKFTKLKEQMVALQKLKTEQVIDEKKEETEEERVRKWLENTVKLPQYYQVFKEEGFEDFESISELTQDNLKEMGVNKMAHRNKIMREIRKLNYSEPQQEIAPAQAAYSQTMPKNEAEGPNVHDTAQ